MKIIELEPDVQICVQTSMKKGQLFEDDYGMCFVVVNDVPLKYPSGPGDYFIFRAKKIGNPEKIENWKKVMKSNGWFW